MRGSGKKRPALNVGDRVIVKRKLSWKKRVFMVSECLRDSTDGRDPVRVMCFDASGRKESYWGRRREFYRLNLPPVDMSVYQKGNSAGAAAPATQKAKLHPGVLERREHPVYIGQLAKATFLADLARDMEATAKRQARAFPTCKCCGLPMRVVVKHHSNYSESRFACDK